MARRRFEGPSAVPLTCPSADPGWADAQLIGVVGGSVDAPEVHYVAPRPVTPELLALASPVTPTEVFRFASRCQEGACGHFREGKCGVAAAMVAKVEGLEVQSVPHCSIRSTCRWWAEHGATACRRCARVVTDDRARDPAFTLALVPPQ